MNFTCIVIGVIAVVVGFVCGFTFKPKEKKNKDKGGESK